MQSLSYKTPFIEKHFLYFTLLTLYIVFLEQQAKTEHKLRLFVGRAQNGNVISRLYRVCNQVLLRPW